MVIAFYNNNVIGVNETFKLRMESEGWNGSSCESGTVGADWISKKILKIIVQYFCIF